MKVSEFVTHIAEKLSLVIEYKASKDPVITDCTINSTDMEFLHLLARIVNAEVCWVGLNHYIIEDL